MLVIGKIVAGALGGAALNCIGWFLYSVIISSIAAGYLDIGGGWGGNFVFGLFGAVVGFFIGGIVGLFQFTQFQSIVGCTGMSILFYFILLNAAYSHPVTQANLEEVNLNWWLGLIFGFLPLVLVSIFVGWIVAYNCEIKKTGEN